jgi:hypothetical protein
MQRVRMTEEELLAGLGILGVTLEQFQHPLRANSQDEGARRLADLKANVKRAFRKAALDLHPDRTGGDEEKAGRFKLASSVAEVVEALTLHVQRPRPPPPVPRGGVVIINMQPGVHVRWTTGSASTGSATTTTTNGWPWDAGGF